MTTERREEPPNVRSLETRIRNAATARGRLERRIARAVANAVLGQMLPDGVVKGGTAIKLRLGEEASRFTPDLDVTRAASLSVEGYVAALRERLVDGWGGFTGTVTVREPARPPGIPAEYVMRPFSVKLSFKGRSWLTVPLELGHDEIGSAAVAELRIAGDIIELFRELGLETPGPIALLEVSHQVAQKLHACTWVSPREGANDRAHDLVDLQLLDQEETIDLKELATVAARLFAVRGEQTWPPTIVAHDGWASIYVEAADGLEVLVNVEDAVVWANDLIARAVLA